MKKSTREVSDLSHVCFLPIIEHFFFIFEHYSLSYNDFLVSGSKHTAQISWEILRVMVITIIESQKKVLIFLGGGFFFCIYTDAML